MINRRDYRDYSRASLTSGIWSMVASKNGSRPIIGAGLKIQWQRPSGVQISLPPLFSNFY
ncbi:MAG: hypothetical protein ACFFFB_23195 [Candidatus Heimdallarchaeota archaeon]